MKEGEKNVLTRIFRKRYSWILPDIVWLHRAIQLKPVALENVPTAQTEQVEVPKNKKMQVRQEFKTCICLFTNNGKLTKMKYTCIVAY
jgi:hypothetical protein